MEGVFFVGMIAGAALILAIGVFICVMAYKEMEG